MLEPDALLSATLAQLLHSPARRFNHQHNALTLTRIDHCAGGTHRQPAVLTMPYVV
jgi:hypothetical protein